MTVQEKYPLPDDERKLLVQTLLLSDVLLLVFGVVGAVIATATRSCDLQWTLFGGGALAELFASLTWHPAAIVVPVVIIVVVQLFENYAYPRIESFARASDQNRQGVTGELMRLPLPLIIVFMIVVGFVEELAFRYALLGWLVTLLTLFAPRAVAVSAALLITSLVFTVVHTQYHNRWSMVTVFVLGLIFGILFLATNSLLVVAIAHALYDILELLCERWRMMHEEDYFKGAVPTHTLVEMAARESE